MWVLIAVINNEKRTYLYEAHEYKTILQNIRQIMDFISEAEDRSVKLKLRWEP